MIMVHKVVYYTAVIANFKCSELNLKLVRKFYFIQKKGPTNSAQLKFQFNRKLFEYQYAGRDSERSAGKFISKI